MAMALSLSIRFSHFHAHPAQFFVKLTRAQERPPFVKEDFHGTPHGHPAGDNQAFAKHDRQCSCLTTEQLARESTSGQKRQANNRLVRPCLRRWRNSSRFRLAL